MKHLHRSLTRFSIAVIIFCLVSCQTIIRPTQYQVKRISDGDTLTVINAQGTDVKVRFACVDAPEIAHSTQEKYSKNTILRDQFKWGIKAADRVKQLVTQSGDRVNLTITDSDRYGRQIAEVRLSNGTLIQEVLVREGLALVYRPYLKSCPTTATRLEQAETQARQQQQGVWSDPKFLEPWNYRSYSRKH